MDNQYCREYAAQPVRNSGWWCKFLLEGTFVCIAAYKALYVGKWDQGAFFLILGVYEYLIRKFGF